MRSVITPQYFYVWSKQFEGEVPHIYLDVKGLATIGIGNLIDPFGAAQTLPFVRADGSPASAAEIEAEWLLIKSHTELARQGYRAAGKLCRLHLEPEAIAILVQSKNNANWAWMRDHYFPGIEAWPACAQLGACSMAWAIGAGWPAIFKRLAAACKAQDWATASKQCSISTKGNPGVAPRNAAVIALFAKAAAQSPEEYDSL